jgi:quinol monooxygenase YgiN
LDAGTFQQFRRVDAFLPRRKCGGRRKHFQDSSTLSGLPDKPAGGNQRGNAAFRKDICMAKVTVIATLRAKPGKENVLKDHLTTLVGYTRAEMGCLDYDLHQLRDDPSVFVMYENWTDQSELDKHLAMPYMVDFVAAAQELLRSPLELQLLEMLSTPKQ